MRDGYRRKTLLTSEGRADRGGVHKGNRVVVPYNRRSSARRDASVTAFLSLLVFVLDPLRIALPLGAVQRVVRAAHLVPLPGAPAMVVGALNLAGEVVPVLDLRARFGLAPRALRAEDQFLIVHGARRALALAVDDTGEVAEYDAAAVVPAATIAPGLAHLRGVLRLADGLLLIQDPAQFLSLDEERVLECALEEEICDAG